MCALKYRVLNLLLGVAIALAASPDVRADDTEIFVTQAGAGTGVKPNILFVLDTSGSMATNVVTQVPYDPATTYTGACDTSRVYWRLGTGSPPRCSTTSQWFAGTQMKCNAAQIALNNAGYTPSSFRARMWRNGSTSGTRIWDLMRDTEHNQPVECQVDAGVHGDGVSLTRLWARNGTASPGQWTSLPSNQISWSGTSSYIFYSGNYLNWRENFSTVSQSRLSIVQDVAVTLLSSITGVNVGLMRYSSNANAGCPNANEVANQGISAEGGMVTYPVSDIESGTVRQDLIDTVKSYNADGCTPLSETLYEATQYFRGAAVDYGLTSELSPGNPFPSVDASRDPADTSQYLSPMAQSCQKNFIVYLTDGEPTADNGADDKILALPGWSGAVTNAPTTPTDCGPTGAGRCLDELAEYLFKADLSTGPGGLPGTQNVTSYWIGFGPDVTGSALLQTTGAKGGGAYYTAADTATLGEILTNIVTEIQNINTTFTAPSVSVNAFNRTQTLDDLYVSVFHPSGSYRWPGNIKKYRLFEGQIVDANGNLAVDPQTGFFSDTAQSFWSGAIDGDDVTLGGAASRQPANPVTRNVYTYLGVNAALTNAGNAFVTGNAAITDAMIGLTGTAGEPTRTELFNWARGHDVQDLDNDTDVTEARLEMGDPLHGTPAVVIYGGTQASPNVNDAVVYAPTNDGYLHAIDVLTGDELWSFIPPEMLNGLNGIYDNAPTANRHYGLDGELRMLKFDVDQNGVVEPSEGDRVFLYFGMGRGGRNYYAIEVTDKNNPRYLWTRTPATPGLGKLGETWSAASLTRVNVGGAAQNTQKLVLIVGGGYDNSQDNVDYNTDTIGNAVYMIDATTGTKLWSASDSGADTNIAAMTHSIPANISVIDLDGDTFADRMYASDTGGRVFRFDIFNGQPVASLVTGGMIADLGAAPLSAPRPRSESRRFYNAPDVALMKRRGKSPFFNIALGSGYRGHPLNTEIHDRFYSVRDYTPFVKLTQAAYAAFNVIDEADLVDVTDDATPALADNAPGWKLELRYPNGWEGEKVLVESLTLDNKVFFTTYLPNAAGPGSCANAAGAGSNRAYAISAFDGSPVIDQDGDVTNLDIGDRFVPLNQGGIAPKVVTLFPDNGPTPPQDCAQGDTRPECKCVLEPEKCPPVVCLSGAEVLQVCRDMNTRIKTFWLESGAN
jgi:type IV pilus assembly protein PilY1